MPEPTTRVVTDLSKVEQALSELYTSAAEPAGPNTAPMIRALLANLVVYACDGREAEEAAATIADVTGSHPCRALIVQTDGTGGEESAYVSAVCAVTERNDRQLCGEIIRLRAPVGLDTTGLVLPLLVADVPFYLWAPCETAFDNESFVNLIREADHVIVDSRKFHDLKLGLERVASVCRNEEHGCLSENLGWYSLLTWRELIAQHFDPPVFRERLSRLRRIAIQFAVGPCNAAGSCDSERSEESRGQVLHSLGNAEHSRSLRGESGSAAQQSREDSCRDCVQNEKHDRSDASCPPAAALLMAGWLIKRTGLTVHDTSPATTGELRVQTTQNDHEVDIVLTPVESSAPSGSLISVTIQASDNGDTATFITKSESAGEVTASMECAGVCLPAQVLELPPTTDATLVHEALDSTSRDATYHEALEVACGLVEGWPITG